MLFNSLKRQDNYVHMIKLYERLMHYNPNPNDVIHTHIKNIIQDLKIQNFDKVLENIDEVN
jgi:hypothetical protein